MQRRVRTSDGTVIYYEITPGTRAAWLVFLHGAGGDLTAWRHERAYLGRAGISTLALDLRGHGLSDRPASYAQYALAAFARDVRAVLEAEQIKKYLLVGHCFGGVVAMSYQTLWPNDAAGYVLIDTTYKAPAPLRYVFRQHPFFTGLINRVLAAAPTRDGAFAHVNFDRYARTGDWDYHRILSDISHTTWRSWLFTYEQLAGFDGRAALRSIRRPTLILEGSADTIFPPAVAQKIHHLVPHSSLKLVPEANHIVVISEPRDIAASIYDFFKKIRS